MLERWGDHRLVGKRVLVVEDDDLQACEVILTLEGQGSEMVGPFFPVVAGRSDKAQIPFIFATGATQTAFQIVSAVFDASRSLQP